MGMGMMGGGGAPFDAGAAFKAEKEIMGIVNHEWIAEKAERELLGDFYPEQATGDAYDLSK
jgi:hypothetical protein